MRIERSTSSTAGDLWTAIESPVKQAGALEKAAQELAKEFHTRFSESVVIARVFVTLPFQSLPASNKEFVNNLAESAGGAAELKPNTPVLSLIGTHGHEADWNDRSKSQGHVGIPLISSAFVGAIPMIARLLKELGVPLEWVDGHDSEMIIRTMGTSAGLFFVDDAGEATDHQGRKIIAAQDFVSSYNVKSVFGIGGAYPNGHILVVVVFCRDTLSRATAEGFLALTNLFISQTSRLAEPAKVFANG
jgi:histone H3/H4